MKEIRLRLTLSDIQYQIKEFDSNICFWVTDTKSQNYKNFEYQLYNKEERLIEITSSKIKINLKCDDLLITLLNNLLLPIAGIKFEINLYIGEHNWLMFMNAFAKAFELLSSQGSYIYQVEINLKYHNIQWIEFSDIFKSLLLLSTFKVKVVNINKWIVSEETFKQIIENEGIQWI